MSTRDDIASDDRRGTVPVRRSEIRRVAAASFIGTTIEWYDFFIYATASALIFNTQFFPTGDPVSGTMLAFATFGIGFLARPLGGVVAGHFGDRFGRRTVLISTLIVMGVATTAIGLLPNYATIGVAAPIILVLLRLLQGLSAGGEWGGAALMAVEHAPIGRRGLWGSISQIGVPTGLILANCAILLVQVLMTPEQFADWGWRIPFLLSIVLVGVGLVIRFGVSESPVFDSVRRSRTGTAVPLVDMVRRHRRELVIATLTYVANSAIPYIFLVFLLSYGTSELGLSATTMLVVVIVGAIGWLPAIVYAGHLSDRLGRRRVYLFGYAILILWAFPFFLLIDTGNVGLMIVSTLVLTFGSGLAYGPQAALFAEMFDADVRYSGVSTSFAMGTVLGGAFAPLIATALLVAAGTSLAVSTYMVAIALVSFGATLAVREKALRAARETDLRNAGHGTP